MTNIVIDIIILSFAKNEDLKLVTQKCIDTLLASEKNSGIQFNILVLESNKNIIPFQYKNAKTIYPKQKFGFNKYLNIGIQQTSSEYICLCNNDLIFHESWASEILKAMQKDSEIMSASPYCPSFHSSRGINQDQKITYGYVNGIHVTGWCLFIKRSLLETIGHFDENFVFWCCDDDYRMTLQKYQIKHALISTSVVEHLESISIKSLDNNKKTRSFKTKSLTSAQQHYFDYKWSHHNLLVLYAKYLKLYLFDK